MTGESLTFPDKYRFKIPRCLVPLSNTIPGTGSWLSPLGRLLARLQSCFLEASAILSCVCLIIQA
jgi:hypothetical protein